MSGLRPDPDHAAGHEPGKGAVETDPALRWRLTEELFHRALETPAEERTDRLTEWTGGDTALIDSVLALIEADLSVEDRIASAPVPDPQDYLSRDLSSGHGEADDGQASGADDDLWIGRVLGAFRIERMLGRGGMGVVFLGQRVSGGFTQRVAIKLVGRHLRSSPAVAQFLLERETLAKLEHGNIARLLDGGVTTEGFPYVVMEYIEGRRLDAACDDPATSIEQVIRWMLQLCDAVAYVHRNLILHRDLKPGNVMVMEEAGSKDAANGQVKLLDFGTLKRIGPDDGTESAMTQAGMRPVTVRYASPEHIEGTGVSTAADVYSLGMMLYRLIAGQLPEGLDDLPIGTYLERLREAKFRPASEIAIASGRALDAQTGRDLDSIIAKALRAEPEARYLTAGALADDLWNVLLHRPVTARAGGLRYRAGKFYRRRRLPVLATAAALLVLVDGLSVMAWQGHRAHIEQLRADKGVEDERKLAHMLLFDYFEQLSLVPGSVEAQKKAVVQAMRYLDGLAKIAPGSSLELETITGYTDMGDLLGDPYKQNLGDIPGAIQSLSKAETLAQARVGRNPNDLPSLQALLISQYTLGETYLANGDAVTGERILKGGAETAARIAGDPRATGELLLHASSALDVLGDVYDPRRGYVTANLDKAMESYLLSDKYERQCLKADPANQMCTSGAVVGEYKFGSLVEESDPALAASHYRAGLADVLAFPPDLMKTTRSHRLKNYMLCRLGLMQIRMGHMADGQATENECLDGLRDAIAKAELDNRARFDLVAMETDLAAEYDRFGKEKEAAAAAHEVLDTLAVLLSRSPKNTRWRMIQGQDLMTEGRVETKLGHLATGREASRKGLDQLVGMAQEKDASPELLELAADGLLELHLHKGDAALALDFAQKAAKTYARPATSQLLTLAKAQLAVGHTKEAEKDARMVLAALAGPVKSKVIAEEIAEARSVLEHGAA